MTSLNKNADNALLYDSKSDLSLIAKALYYIATKEFNLAIPHLEKALEYNPNSAPVILMLSDMYARVTPDTQKYLTYALKGIQLEKNSNDSIAQSFIYLHLSNALVQAGFAKESLVHINNSLSYYPANSFAPYLKGFITYANTKDRDELLHTLETEWEKDTTRVDLLQELGKFHYFSEDYTQSFRYYQKYLALQEGKADLYPFENLKMGIVYQKMGDEKKAQELFTAYRKHCTSDQTTYQPTSLAMQYIFDGKYDDAIAEFQKFSNQSNFHYWMILFMESDPLLKKLKSHKDYKATMQQIRDQFWEQHESVRKLLKENKLL